MDKQICKNSPFRSSFDKQYGKGERLVDGSSERGLFRDMFNHVFWSPLFRKYISYESHILFENIQSLIQISKMQKQI